MFRVQKYYSKSFADRKLTLGAGSAATLVEGADSTAFAAFTLDALFSAFAIFFVLFSFDTVVLFGERPLFGLVDFCAAAGAFLVAIARDSD